MFSMVGCRNLAFFRFESDGSYKVLQSIFGDERFEWAMLCSLRFQEKSFGPKDDLGEPEYRSHCWYED